MHGAGFMDDEQSRAALEMGPGKTATGPSCSALPLASCGTLLADVAFTLEH